jgi:hypothetical protein
MGYFTATTEIATRPRGSANGCTVDRVGGRNKKKLA